MGDRHQSTEEVTAMGSIGFQEIGILVLIGLIIFGAGKLPQVGGALGKSLREFRKAKDSNDEKPQDEDKARQK